jgi:hypothetical protein
MPAQTELACIVWIYCGDAIHGFSPHLDFAGPVTKFACGPLHCIISGARVNDLGSKMRHSRPQFERGLAHSNPNRKPRPQWREYVNFKFCCKNATNPILAIRYIIAAHQQVVNAENNWLIANFLWSLFWRSEGNYWVAP